MQSAHVGCGKLSCTTTTSQLHVSHDQCPKKSHGKGRARAKGIDQWLLCPNCRLVRWSFISAQQVVSDYANLSLVTIIVDTYITTLTCSLIVFTVPRISSAVPRVFSQCPIFNTGPRTLKAVPKKRIRALGFDSIALVSYSIASENYDRNASKTTEWPIRNLAFLLWQKGNPASTKHCSRHSCIDYTNFAVNNTIYTWQWGSALRGTALEIQGTENTFPGGVCYLTLLQAEWLKFFSFFPFFFCAYGFYYYMCACADTNLGLFLWTVLSMTFFFIHSHCTSRDYFILASSLLSAFPVLVQLEGNRKNAEVCAWPYLIV